MNRLSLADFCRLVCNPISDRRADGYLSAHAYVPMEWDYLLFLEKSLKREGYQTVFLFQQKNAPYPVKVYVTWERGDAN